VRREPLTVPPVTGPLDTVLEHMSVALAATDPDLRITYLSEHAQRLLGQDADALLGRHVGDLFPDGGDVFKCQFEAAALELRATSFSLYDPSVSHWFAYRACPTPSGVTILFEEIDLRKSSQERSHQQMDELSCALTAERALRTVATAVASRPDLRELLELACESAHLQRAPP
jgi:nitrogen fixation/metabolism regulation signal transduction histidine kinase